MQQTKKAQNEQALHMSSMYPSFSGAANSSTAVGTTNEATLILKINHDLTKETVERDSSDVSLSKKIQHGLIQEMVERDSSEDSLGRTRQFTP